MKHLKLFEQFILEAFNLQKMYDKQNILPEIQNYAENMINKRLEGRDNIPRDIQKNRERIIFCFFCF